MIGYLFRFALVMGLLSVGAWAQSTEGMENEEAAMQKAAASLQYREGVTVLKNGLATVNATNGFRFLEAKDAQTVLTQFWGNPKSDGVLGLIVPEGFSPMAEDAWAVVVSFEESGYVKDDDASKLDYDQLLKDMQESTREGTKEREKQGYSSVELVGWATRPHYDQSTHKIYWAKHLRFGGGQEGDTLNYCIRALGRRGVLQLNAVAGMDQLPAVEKATPAILEMVNFQEGHRYVDFQEGTDKVAAYGLAALVTGGVLAKTGFLKVLLGGLMAAKKLVIVGAIGLFAVLKKFLGGRSSANS